MIFSFMYELKLTLMVVNYMQDNVPITKRRLFKRVLKGKGKETQTENVHIYI